MNEFPDIETWRQTVVKYGDMPQYLRPDFYEYYRNKYLIASKVRPLDSIAEIGVRYGYSAFSFLCASPSAHYTGFDLSAGTHGGVRDEEAFAYVRAMLGAHFPTAQIDLQCADTRKMREIGGPYDLVHVDGDHSEDAARHDIWMALEAVREGGVVLVDDVRYIDGVRRAAEYILETCQPFIAESHFEESLRGELVLFKKEVR